MHRLLLSALLFLVLTVLFNSSQATAQVIPSDLSSTRVDDLSDAQINQLLQQAGNYTDEQIIKAAEAKGLPRAESVKLQNRINLVRKNGQTESTAQSNSTGNVQRNLTAPADEATISKPATQTGPRVFGADLFNNANLTFAPNLKIATPKNYIIGPDDELNINIYGNSLVNWKLEVSPEGNINIPGVGLLNVTGKSIEQATTSIRAKLVANNYAIGSGTNLQVSLGNIRSIKVILIGELTRPGTYTLPSLATAFNALYAAGGPGTNGSFRQIEIIRNNKIVRTLDIYDFLLRGDQKNNITLQDQDIIRVPTYRIHVQMSGEVKTPAIFEVLPGETLQNVIGFASGFTDLAYTSRIKVLQVNEQQRRVTDIIEADYKNYIPLRGDQYIVERILDRVENQVTINGAVFRPGIYELDKGLTLSQLIQKAAGLKEDAFTGRGTITRLKADNTTELLSFDVKSVVNKSAPDITLQREDVVTIASIFDLRDNYTVKINGEVRQPGEFSYSENMKVADLILQAGGFTEGASPKRIEVAQRKHNSDATSASSEVAVVYTVNLDENLGLNQADFVLHPFDIVSVYSLPGYEKQRTVKIEGEVLYPGYYTIKIKNEKISDVIARAGSLTVLADADGSSLKRTNTAILGIDKAKTDTSALLAEKASQLQLTKQALNDTTAVQLRNNYIGINLKKILEKPGSVTDLILEDGDVIRVPKQQQVVRINGEVLYPSAVVFEKGKSFRSYVLNAGGYSPNALKRRAYIVYANGTVKGSSKFLFFNSHPSVKPGSEIFVPKKPEPKGSKVQEILGLTTGLASLGAIILGIISLRK